MTEDLDLLLEWCSLRGSGTRDQFAAACQDMVTDIAAAQVLARLEKLGHVDVDWDHDRWAVVPTSLALIEGSGGNAVLLGARTAATWARLAALASVGLVKSVTALENGLGYPSSWFVGVSSGDNLDDITAEFGAKAVTRPVQTALNHFVGLYAVLSASTARFVPSGFQARKFDTQTLRFVDTEVSRDAWPPGCFEQRSRGRNRYLFVNDTGVRHLADRWIAIHAELDRCRRNGIPVPDVLLWDKRTERMANLSGAQLPVQWARAAILCAGVAPRRITSGTWTNIYEGVKITLWRRFCDALEIPRVQGDLSRFD